MATHLRTRDGKAIRIETGKDPVGRGFYRSLTPGAPRRPASSPVSNTITKRKLLQLALEEQASIDMLTRALNRATFSARASIELLRAGRSGHKLSMVMADLDHFKEINDTCGHAAGDQVLSIFADVTRECLRVGDVLGRWGGEEFLILLPDTGPSGRSPDRRKNPRGARGHAAFRAQTRVTASLGVAAQRPGEGLATLVRTRRRSHVPSQADRDATASSRTWTIWRERQKAIPIAFIFFELYWRRHYECGIPEIDAEHMQLFKIANRILASLSARWKQRRRSSAWWMNY